MPSGECLGHWHIHQHVLWWPWRAQFLRQAFPCSLSGIYRCLYVTVETTILFARSISTTGSSTYWSRTEEPNLFQKLSRDCLRFSCCSILIRHLPQTFSGHSTFCAKAVAWKSYQRSGASFHQSLKVASYNILILYNRLPPWLPLPCLTWTWVSCLNQSWEVVIATTKFTYWIIIHKIPGKFPPVLKIRGLLHRNGAKTQK